MAAALLIATAGSFLSSWSSYLDLLSHFRPQLAALGLVAIAASLWTRSWAVLVASLVLAAVNAAPLVPYLAGGPVSASRAVEGQERIRFLTFNLHGRSTDPEDLRRLLEREKPDIVLLAEVPHETRSAVQGWADIYPHQILEDGGLPVDAVLLSRWEIRGKSVDRSVMRYRSTLTVRLCDPDLNRRCFTLIGLHAEQPFGGGARRQRAQLAGVVREAKAASTGAVVVMGDLNVTPWARGFRLLIDGAGLTDTARTRKLSATWRSRFPLLGLHIDHILVNSGFTPIESRVGEDIGSDHFPVIADLILKSE
ncbi:endonuclease/exonuclease/phosphatase family protein [Microvirga subterranea]|uniref:endonuclease/exonuclease/phosphatase family protein n=1 Tax=Microvirga subterranea TaxID=186651 RepID=UPI001474F7E2|nr:endonuclease/exonuclease/phosphatase family protein [Microvirga subterranea]